MAILKSNCIFLIGIILMGCQNPKSKPVLAGNHVELEAFFVDYYKTMSDRDWKAYQEYFTDQAVLTTIWAESAEEKPTIFTSSITEFISKTGEGPDSQPVFEELPISIEVEVRGGMANAWVRYEAKFGTEENMFEWKGTDLFSLLKYQGRWYITALTYVSDE